MDRKFKDDVCELVAYVPSGRVMTYGQIAALCGHPGAARVVGQIAHFGPDNLPWHRVVNSKGSMANGFPLGPNLQAQLLAKENVRLTKNRLVLSDYIWWPVKQPVKTVAIVGPTASGKTSLAIKVARNYNGEVISADSRAIYKQMDIATAKPTKNQQKLVKHWGLDLIEPNKKYSADDFKNYAAKKIKEIHIRKRIAVLAGGSGLYVNGVIYDYSFAPQDPETRTSLQNKTIEELQEIIKDKQLDMPNNKKNKRYLTRSIERSDYKLTRNILCPNTILVGLNPPKNIMQSNIANRIDSMIDAGLYDEICKLSKWYTSDMESMKSNAIVAFSKYISREISETEAKATAIKLDMSLAKKQMTWFKRNKDIVWFDNSKSA